jgi:hypothetical protein
MDFDIERAKTLIAERDALKIDEARATVARFDAINGELKSIFATDSSNVVPIRKPQKCKKCGQPGHISRTCTAQTEAV